MVLQQNRVLEIQDKYVYQLNTLISRGTKEASPNPSYILMCFYRDGHP